jgi:hypothetical protein
MRVARLRILNPSKVSSLIILHGLAKTAELTATTPNIPGFTVRDLIGYFFG